MRNILIGDVHGCLDEFRELLRLVSYKQGSDRLIQVGDLLDRGPDPVGCVRFAREVGAELVLGNHEEKHLRFRKHEEARARSGKKNPIKGFDAEKSAQNAALSEDDLAYLAAAPLVLRVNESLVAVHAGLEPAFPVASQSSAVVRVRYVDSAGEMVGFAQGSLEQPEGTDYWASRWRGPESVVYGHAVHSLSDPRVDRFEGGACYGIDTGCVFGGRLSAFVLAGGAVEVAQVQAHRRYCEQAHV